MICCFPTLVPLMMSNPAPITSIPGRHGKSDFPHCPPRSDGIDAGFPRHEWVHIDARIITTDVFGKNMMVSPWKECYWTPDDVPPEEQVEHRQVSGRNHV
jgi:hypothetical protein